MMLATRKIKLNDGLADTGPKSQLQHFGMNLHPKPLNTASVSKLSLNRDCQQYASDKSCQLNQTAYINFATLNPSPTQTLQVSTGMKSLNHLNH